MTPQTVVLVILDGWGIGPAWGGNAISQARTPLSDWLWHQPTAVLQASGKAVGLSGHERGNSEVGHLTIGTGRIILQDSTRISSEIRNHTFEKNSVLQNVITQTRQRGGRLHLMGLLSRSNVHASLEHAIALVRLAHAFDVRDVRLHLFTDGRDSDPRDGLTQVDLLEEELRTLGIGKIQTLCGRYYAMDRDDHWDRTEKAYRLIALGEGVRAENARLGISQAYTKGTTDEFIEPTVIESPDEPAYSGVGPDDAIIFWNFRSDRARQLSRAFTDPNLPTIRRPTPFQPVPFVSLTPYGAEHDIPGVLAAFRPEPIHHSLGEEIAIDHHRQFHIAETEKYAHVTYFLNGGIEEPLPGEERLLIPSPSVATYDLAPAMSAEEITKAVIHKIKNKGDQLIVANYANADMVAHTGNFQATVEAIEVIDQELTKLAKIAEEQQISLIVTADHGNAEQMVNPQTGEPDTAHTTNPVPCHFVMPGDFILTHQDGLLADIAPTILYLLGKPIPKEMTGANLLRSPQR